MASVERQWQSTLAGSESQPCHDPALNDSAMTAPIIAAAFFLIATTSAHVVSIVIAAVRLRRDASGKLGPFQKLPPVSLVRPLCGMDNHADDTLRSTFELDYPRCEILFCVASAKDPDLIGQLARGSFLCRADGSAQRKANIVTGTVA
jgi:hypothetical protein